MLQNKPESLDAPYAFAEWPFTGAHAQTQQSSQRLRRQIAAHRHTRGTMGDTDAHNHRIDKRPHVRDTTGAKQDRDAAHARRILLFNGRRILLFNGDRRNGSSRLAPANRHPHALSFTIRRASGENCGAAGAVRLRLVKSGFSLPAKSHPKPLDHPAPPARPATPFLRFARRSWL